MDKKKVGQFLKQLRQEKNLSQEKLVQEYSAFLGLSEVVTVASISKWERGESFPDIGNIEDLAAFFDVSIDEIFNGEREKMENYERKYFISDNNWASCYIPENAEEMVKLWGLDEQNLNIWKKTNKQGLNLWAIRQQQELDIEKNFQELLGKLVENTLSTTEEKEFDFICAHFYSLKDEMSLEKVKFDIRKQCALMHKSSFDEKYWESYKFFDYDRKLKFYYDICDAVLTDQNIIVERIKNTMDFEKDVLLAFVQKNSFYNPHGEMRKEQFLKVYGIEYDIEKLTKEIIKVLIENGACLHDALLGYEENWKISRSIVDALVQGYERYERPILVSVFENGTNSYYLVENTEKNRVLVGMEDIEPAILEIGLEELERKLYSGEETFTEDCFCWKGMEDIKSKEFSGREYEILCESLDYVRQVIHTKSYADYYAGRKIQETRELLKDLETLSLNEIREKYFTMESKIYE